MSEGSKGHVVVAGASGLVGRAAVEHYSSSGYEVTAVSRRAPVGSYERTTFVPLDLKDEQASAEALGGLTDVTRIVYAALQEDTNLVEGWSEEENMRRNGAMFRNLLEPLDEAAELEHVVVLQGAKAYGLHQGPIPLAAREDRDEARDVPTFYWLQQEYLEKRSAKSGFRWTIFRPEGVTGCAIGSPMNMISSLGVYGALLKDAGEPLHYPGGATPIMAGTDTELMARAFDWAAGAPEADSEAFNITNGDVFTLRDLWPAIADALGMEPGDDVPMALGEEMPTRAAEWDAIRARHGLVAPSMDEFVGQSFVYTDYCLATGMDTASAPIIYSNVKLRQAGFNETIYDEVMYRRWFDRYRSERLLPPI